MTYEELKIQLDINDPASVLNYVGAQYSDDKWFVICNDGDCHLFKDDGAECDVREVKEINENFIFKNIHKIVIPSGVTNIGDCAFYNCSNLVSLMIPNSVTSIGSSTFCHCISLTSMTIPNSVKSIGENALYGCAGLTSVTIRKSMTSIGEYAFYGCTSLKSIVFKGKTMEQVKGMDFYPWGIEDKSAIKCRN